MSMHPVRSLGSSFAPPAGQGQGLPANLAAERAILGAVLLDNRHYWEAAGRIDATDFSLDAHRRIFTRIGELLHSEQSVDIVTIAEQLQGNKELSVIGGAAYLASLTEGLPQRWLRGLIWRTLEKFETQIKEPAFGEADVHGLKIAWGHHHRELDILYRPALDGHESFNACIIIAGWIEWLQSCHQCGVLNSWQSTETVLQLGPKMESGQAVIIITGQRDGHGYSLFGVESQVDILEFPKGAEHQTSAVK